MTAGLFLLEQPLLPLLRPFASEMSRAAVAVIKPEPVASVSQHCCSGSSMTVAQPFARGTALFSRMASACGAVRPLFCWAMSATIPATCGLAIDVPLR